MPDKVESIFRLAAQTEFIITDIRPALWGGGNANSIGVNVWHGAEHREEFEHGTLNVTEHVGLERYAIHVDERQLFTWQDFEQMMEKVAPTDEHRKRTTRYRQPAPPNGSLVHITGL